MTPETLRLIHEALDAHDTALADIQASGDNIVGSSELAAHTGDLVRDIATTMRAAHESNRRSIDTVMRANRRLLAALRAEEEPK